MKDTIAITNRTLVKGDYLAQLERVVSLHPNAMILREKDLSDEAYEELAKQVLAICEEGEVPCFLHGHMELAVKLGCKNIHLPISYLSGLPAYKAHFSQISVACHSLSDVKLAINSGATRIILGTIFETDCKKGLKGKGLAFVEEICDYCKNHGNIPVYAIGGISPDNLPSVKEKGAAGGCMMSYLMRI